jgi:ABC-2 type transport system ATP-binding protein
MGAKMGAIIEVNGLVKRYKSGFEALKGVNLTINEGEIIALLGPNGAGKTTLISSICGITNPTSGSVSVGGFDINAEYRKTRAMIGLVPQELNLEHFEKVIATVRFSRGLFGKPADEAHIEKILRQLSLWDKRNAKIGELSGGMKRRVLIAKALAHEPRVLFLDEPTAGVDVELRKDMWAVVQDLKASGVTIILTTHYIEEAEEVADRIGVINGGQILLVQGKAELMQQLGQKQMQIDLAEPLALDKLPEALGHYNLSVTNDLAALIYTYDINAERTGITTLLGDLQAAGFVLRDIQTKQSSLEEIFVGLVADQDARRANAGDAA